MTRRAWTVIALLGAGWFIHDAIWHFLLATIGMRSVVALEFSLPDLSVYHLQPDRAVQALGCLVAAALAGLLLTIGIRRLAAPPA